ncbi:MAG: GNAT family N-acetyltransferase [Anaerolineales bacterium]
MGFKIAEVGIAGLSEYAKVPICFEVRSIFEVELLEDGLGGMLLHERAVAAASVKDYDALPGGRPEDWPQEFDLRNWAIFLATERGRPVGGATVAYNTAGVNMLEGREDLAVLWDIRVHPDARGRGIGRALFRRAVTFARERSCSQLKVETQNVNVRACRFYAAQGCRLGVIHRYAYAGEPAVADEVMLLWYLDLRKEGAR